MVKPLTLMMAAALAILTFSPVTAQSVISIVDSSYYYKYSSEADSIPISKSYFISNDSLNLSVTETKLFWNEGSLTWTPRYKNVKETEPNGSYVTLQYNWDQSKWNESFKIDWFNNSAGQLIDGATYFWNSDRSEWAGVMRNENLYDSLGNKTKFIYSGWNQENWAWEMRSFVEYENILDASGRLISTTGILHMDDEVRNSEKYDYLYDESGNTAQEIYFKWDVDSSRWIGQYKKDWKYSAIGLETEEDYSSWIVDSANWYVDQKRERSYDNQKRIISEKVSKWNYNTETWTQSKVTYAFDAYGRSAKTFRYTWDNIQEVYLKTYRTFRFSGVYTHCLYQLLCEGDEFIWQGDTYSEEGVFTDTITTLADYDTISKLVLATQPIPQPFTIGGILEFNQWENASYVAPDIPGISYSWTVLNGAITSGEYSDTVNVVWNESGTGEVSAYAEDSVGCKSDITTLQVQITPTGINEVQSQEIKLYPVPVRDFLHITSEIEFSEIEVMGLNGRNLMRFRSGQNEMDLSSLPGGVYFLNIKDSDGNLIETQKLIKE